MPGVDWNKLKDCSGKSAASIPTLLLALSPKMPLEGRLEAEAEFWQRINRDSRLCSATAPAISEYLKMVDAGEVAVTASSLNSLLILYMECQQSENDSANTRAQKVAVRTVIEKYGSLFWRFLELRANPEVSGQAAELLLQFHPQRRKLLDVLLQQFESGDATARRGLLDTLHQLRNVNPGWEQWLSERVRTETDVVRFHAAALLAKLLGSNTPTSIIEILRRFDAFDYGHGFFATYAPTLFEACAALSDTVRVSVLEDVLLAVKSTDQANRICRELLIAAFRTGPRPMDLQITRNSKRVEYQWSPRRPLENREDLSTAECTKLCGVLSHCDALWFEVDGPPILTNLFSEFGLPSERDLVRKLAQLPSLSD